MPQLAKTRIRIKADANNRDEPKNILTQNQIAFWRGADLQFEVGLFQGAAAFIDDVSNLDTLTLEIKTLASGSTAPDPATAPLMEQSVFLADITEVNWDAGTAQHALLEFSAAESNISAGEKWLLIYATTTDSPAETITLVAGKISVKEDGGPSVGDPDAIDPAPLSSAASDARYIRRDYVDLIFHGDLADEQSFGFWSPKIACRILGIQLAAQVAPTGAAVTVDLTVGGTEQTKIATLADAASDQETIYGTPLDVAADAAIRAIVKSIGSTEPGGYLTAKLIVQPQPAA